MPLNFEYLVASTIDSSLAAADLVYDFSNLANQNNEPCTLLSFQLVPALVGFSTKAINVTANAVNLSTITTSPVGPDNCLVALSSNEAPIHVLIVDSNTQITTLSFKGLYLSTRTVGPWQALGPNNTVLRDQLVPLLSLPRFACQKQATVVDDPTAMGHLVSGLVAAGLTFIGVVLHMLSRRNKRSKSEAISV